jgi:hypothetical protein
MSTGRTMAQYPTPPRERPAFDEFTGVARPRLGSVERRDHCGDMLVA